MKWRSNWLWVNLLIVCGGIILTRYIWFSAESPVLMKDFMALPLAPPPITAFAIPVSPKIDYLDIILKTGGVSGAVMSLINLVEKIVKWFKKGGKKDA